MKERGENFKASNKVLSLNFDGKLHHLQGRVEKEEGIPGFVG